MNESNSTQKPMPGSQGSSISIGNIEAPTILIFVNVSGVWNGCEFQQGAGIVVVNLNEQLIKLKALYLGKLTYKEANILACTLALESLITSSDVHIFCGSHYVVETMQGRNEMATYRPFWKRLVTACLTHRIDWNHIPRSSADNFQATAERLSQASSIAKTNLDKEAVNRIAMMLKRAPDRKTVQKIHAGVKMLAATCDGAKRADGKGFNKFDSELGKRLAGIPFLSTTEALAARALLTKYRLQIATFDEELALIV